MAEYDITLDTGADTREWLEDATVMPNGNIIHAWLQFKSGAPEVPTVRILQPDGTAITGEYEPTIPIADADYRNVEIHAVSDTQFIVTYTAFNTTTFSNDLYANVLTLSGTTFSSTAPVQITGSDSAGYSGSVSTHLMADGTLAVATSLVTESASPNTAEMYVKTLQIDGSGQLAAISQGTAGYGGTSGFVRIGQQNELQPGSVQLDSNGTSLYIGWTQNSDSNTSTKAYGTFVTVNANGTVSAVPATETLLREGTNGGSFPSVSLDDFVVLENGDLLLLSNGKVATGGSVSDGDNLYGQVWNPTLTAKIGAEFQVNATTDANGTSGEHALAFKGGGFVVFFSQDKDPADDFTRDVYYQIFDNTYTKVGGLVNVTDTTDTPLRLNDGDSLGLRVGDDGDVVLVVEQTSYDYSDSDPFGDNQQLRAITLSNLDPNPVPTNLAPVLGAAAPDDTAVEDVATAIDLSAYDISDADGDTITLTLSVNSGTIASVDGNTTVAGVTVAGSGTGSMTLRGSAADLNAYLDDTAKITFLTAANQTGAVTLTVTPFDGTVNGTADTVTINITPVNDAPVLDTSGNPTLTTIVEDAGDDDGSGADGDDDATQNTNNPGTTVGTIIVNGSISDPDGTSTEAMAVTGVDNTNGLWQYSTNGGTSWTNFSGSTGNVALSAPLLLDTNNLVRFVPNADYNGTATFTYRAWDKTFGTAGQTSGTSTGGSSSLSTAVETATITVSAVNDAPVFSGLDGTPAFTEGGSPILLDTDVTVSDTDLDALNGGAGNYSGASLTIVPNLGSAADVFSIQSGGNLTVSGGPDGGGTVSVGGNVIATIADTGNGQLQITFADNGTTPTTGLVNETLHAVRYVNASDDPPASVQLDWTFSDGNTGAQGTGGQGTASGSVTVSITGVDDAPELSAVGLNPTYTENGPASDLFASVSARTVESGQTFTDMTMTVEFLSVGATDILNIDGSDVALVDGAAIQTTAINGLSVNVRVTGNVATVSFAGAALTESEMTTLVDTMTYRNASEDGGTEMPRFTITEVTDSGTTANGGQNTALLGITSDVTVHFVNDAPVVSNVFGETSTVSALSGAQNVGLFDDATVSDLDSPDYSVGFLNIIQTSGVPNGSWRLDGTTATSGGDGTISADETVFVGGASVGVVNVTNDGQAGNALEIQFEAGATPARIETLMRALNFDAPSGPGARSFDLTLNDGDGTTNGGDADISGSFTINVTSAPPVIGNLDGDRVLTATGVPVLIDVGGDVTVTDADTINFNGGVLTITPTSVFSGNLGLRGGTTYPTIVAENGNLPLQGDGVADAGDFIIEAFSATNGTIYGSVVSGSDGKLGNALSIEIDDDNGALEIAKILQNITYSSTELGLHTFSVSLSDGSSSFSGNAELVSFSVVVSSPPVNTVPLDTIATLVDAQPFAFTGANAITVDDPDSETVTVRLDVTDGPGISTSTGTLQATASGAALVTEIDADSLSISGSLADVNATLSSLVFTPAENSGDTKLLTVTTTDGDGNEDVDTISLDVQDRPNIDLNISAFDYPEGSGAISLFDAGLRSISQSDSNGGVRFAETTLVAALAGGATATETLGLDTSGRVSLSAGLTVGSVVSIDGDPVGTIITPNAPGELAIDMTSGAYGSGAIVANLTYTNTLLDTSVQRTLTVRLDQDGLPQSDAESIVINVIAVNDPPSLALTPVETARDENTQILSRLKVADLAITDDTLGENLLSLSGADAALFELDGLELFLSAGAVLDFESNPVLDVVVELDDPALGAGFEDSQTFSLDVLDINEPPSVDLRFTVDTLAEDTDTGDGLRVASIRIFDDALGGNTITLSGADAGLFELDDRVLRLRPDANLDHETNPVLDVVVTVRDGETGLGSSAALAIQVTDVNEAPRLELLSSVAALPEGFSGTERTEVARLAVVDDLPGSNEISLAGEDADLFVIDGQTLFLKAGVFLGLTSTPVLDVSLILDDTTLGFGPEDRIDLSFPVIDTAIFGDAFENDLTGTSIADRIFGLESDDRLEGGAGDDLLSGGPGFDTAVFSGNQSSYTLRFSPTGIEIEDRRSGRDGTDTLLSIEALDFADGLFDIDIRSGATGISAEDLGEIVELYIAYFDRAPAAKGLLYWATRLQEGMSLEEINDSFFAQPEFRETFDPFLNEDGSLSDARGFVTAVFNNMFGRDPSGTYWIDELETNPDMTPGKFMLAVSKGAKAETGNPADAAHLETKVDIGLYFGAIKGLSGYEDTVTVMELYDGTAASLAEAVAAVDQFHTEALDPLTGAFLMPLVGVIDDPFAVA